MTRFPKLQSLLEFADGVRYECRRCGERVDDESTQCPACGANDVGQYQL